MKNYQLPPLPEPHCDAHEDAGFYYPEMFTGNQMRSYALQARAQVSQNAASPATTPSPANMAACQRRSER